MTVYIHLPKESHCNWRSWDPPHMIYEGKGAAERLNKLMGISPTVHGTVRCKNDNNQVIIRVPFGVSLSYEFIRELLGEHLHNKRVCLRGGFNGRKLKKIREHKRLTDVTGNAD